MGLYAKYKCPRCQREGTKQVEDIGALCAIFKYFQCPHCEIWIEMGYSFEYQPFKTITRVFKVSEWIPTTPHIKFNQQALADILGEDML